MNTRQHFCVFIRRYVYKRVCLGLAGSLADCDVIVAGSQWAGGVMVKLDQDDVCVPVNDTDVRLTHICRPPRRTQRRRVVDLASVSGEARRGHVTDRACRRENNACALQAV